MIPSTSMNEIFRGRLVNRADLLRGYMMIIDGKIYTDYRGKFLFDTKAQLTKNFYNTMSWKVKREMWRVNHSNSFENYWGAANDAIRHSYWEEFKKDLKDNHNLEIIAI